MTALAWSGLTYVWLFGWIVLWLRAWWVLERERLEPDYIARFGRDPWYATPLRGAFFFVFGIAWPIWFPIALYDAVRKELRG